MCKKTFWRPPADPGWQEYNSSNVLTTAAETVAVALFAERASERSSVRTIDVPHLPLARKKKEEKLFYRKPTKKSITNQNQNVPTPGGIYYYSAQRTSTHPMRSEPRRTEQ